MARKVSQLPVAMLENRQRVLHALDIREIQSMERDELLVWQSALGFGSTWGVFEAPKQWCAPGPDFVRWVRCDEINTPNGDRSWTEVLRICLLLALTRSVRVYCLPTTICIIGRVAVKVCNLLTMKPGLPTRWWSRATVEELRAGGSAYIQLCSILAMFYRRGLVPDEPTPIRQDDDALERDRYGDSIAEVAPDDSKQWQPLPDAFTAICGQRVLWIVQELGPTLLDCLEAGLAIELPPMSRGSVLKHGYRRAPTTEKTMLRKMRCELVRDWMWRTSDGEALEFLPFELNFKRRVIAGFHKRNNRPSSEIFTWPPRTWGDLWNLITALQTCHAWLLFLASGPRQSTVLSYNINCLVPAPNGYRIDGTLFKTPMVRGGRSRDWPLPPILVQAVRQQVRLASLVKRMGCPAAPGSQGDHLWVTMRAGRDNRSSMGSPLESMNPPLQRLVEVLQLGHLLDSDNPTLHTHRFRKTLARILALALTSAQMVLMDCFGHEDPDMTFGYMLSDKAIVADAMRVQRELVILLAKEAIQQADELGGPMGDKVREAKYQFIRLKNQGALTPEDEYELADQLTLGGRDWVFVMEGVICTLSAFDAGPCGAHKGVRRDPLHCQAGCAHQLILAYHKNHANDMIAYLIQQLQHAQDDGAESLVVQLVAQMKNHLFRWPDVFRRWAAHPQVMRYGIDEFSPSWAREVLPS